MRENEGRYWYLILFKALEIIRGIREDSPEPFRGE